MGELLVIDGSRGEGGGQVLRSALALSLLTGRPFRLINLRAGRPKPGLAAQHLASLRAAALVGQGQVRGGTLGSREVTFMPGPVRGGDWDLDIGTAGAIALVIHTVYLPLLLRGDRVSRLRLTGGTHVKAAPCWEYLAWTWAKYLERLGGQIDLRLERRGFFPAGGGRVDVQIAPGQTLNGLVLAEASPSTPLSPGEIRGLSFAAGGPPATRSPAAIAAEQGQAFNGTLAAHGLRSQIEVQFEHAAQVGTYVGGLLPTSPVPTFHFALGEPGVRAHVVGVTAARLLLEHWQMAPHAVDAHAADQLLLPLVFASGPSRFPVVTVTQHLLTNAEVIGLFVDRVIRIEGAIGQPGWVEIAS